MGDMLFIVGVAATIGLMALGIRLYSTAGGFAGFIAGAVLTGIVAAGLDVDMSGGCSDYGPRAMASDYC